MASKQQIPGQLPADQSGPSEPPFPFPQQGPSHDGSVPQDEEYYSEEEVEQEEPTSSVAAGKRPAFGASSEGTPLTQLPQQLRNERYRTPIQRQQTTDDLNKLYTSLGTNMSGIRRDVRAREDRYQQVENEVRELKLQNQKTESALPEVKVGGSKEVPIALESNVEEINLLREGETKLRRWSTEKPDPLDPPKRQKSKPPKGVARDDPNDLDSSFSDSSGGPPKKKKDHHSVPRSSLSSSSSSLNSSSELGVGLKDKKKDSKKFSDENTKLRWKRFDFSLDKENHLAGWANWEFWSNALSLAMEEIGYGALKVDYRYQEGYENAENAPEDLRSNRQVPAEVLLEGAYSNSSQNNRSNSFRNIRSGGYSEEQFIPEGLRDLYRLDGKTFSAHIEDQQFQDFIRWYDGMI
ncbi:hypothetical protein DL765_008333 [Monosporascus sp. GIB2]|nr:hypothetical protein DL765_008333 [Monosporascus sp. GIB2]